MQHPKQQTAAVIPIIIIGALAAFLAPLFSFATEASICAPQSIATCGLPYPSDHFTRQDDSSPTGRRIQMPNAIHDLLENPRSNDINGLPPMLWPENLLDGHSGFSAAAPVIFELPSEPSAQSLENTYVYVFAQDDPTHAMPVNAGVMESVAGFGPASQPVVMETWPAARWRYGKTHVAVVTHGISPASGGQYPAIPTVNALWESTDPEHQRVSASIDRFLESHQLGRNDVYSMTWFTVRAQGEVMKPLPVLLEKALNEPHPIKNWRVEYHPFNKSRVSVEGKVKLTLHRDEAGAFVWDPEFAGKEYWTDFRLVIPAGASRKPVPLIIYGHGFLGNKSRMVAFESINSANNIATLAIDQPNHGSRIEADGGAMFSLLKPRHMPRALGMVAQSSLDQASLLGAVKTVLSKLNTLPLAGDVDVFPWQSLYAEDDTPDIDPQRVFYGCTSMGCVFGLAFAASTADISGTFAQVPGVGISNVISHSAFWKQFKAMVPREASAGEAAIVIALTQEAVDYGDGVNFVHAFRNSGTRFPYSQGPRPLAITYGVNDSVVVNSTTFNLVRLAKIPMADPEDINLADYFAALPFDKVPLPERFDNGYGAFPVDSGGWSLLHDTLLRDWIEKKITGDWDMLEGHFSHRFKSAKAYQLAWIKAVVSVEAE